MAQGQSKEPGQSRGGRAMAGLLVCMAAFGFLCYRAACWTVFHSGFEDVAAETLVYARAAQVVGIAAFLAISYFMNPDPFLWLKLSVGAAVAMTMAALGIVVAHFSDAATSLVVVSACLAHGFFSSLLLLGWGYFFSSIRPGLSALAIAGAFVLYSFLIPVLQPLPPAVVGTCAVVLPVLCGVVLATVFPFAEFGPVEEGGFKKVAACVPWGLFGLLFLCSMIVGVSKSILPGDIVWNETPLERYWQAVALVVLVAFAFWTVFLRRDDSYALWPLFSFALLCGLLCFSSFYFIDKSAAWAMMRATQEHLTCFIWVFLTGVIYDRRLPKMLCFGVGAVALIHGEHFASYLFEEVFSFESVAGGEFVAVVLATAMAFVLILVTFIALMRRANTLMQATAVSAQASPANETDAMGVALARAYGLSEREAEVVELLLRGHTYQAAADALCISTDTVRYHVKNVYRRTGVHNRQELIELGQELTGCMALPNG